MKRRCGKWFLCAFVIAVCLAAFGVGAAEDRQPRQMEFYQYNTCASCHPEDEFYEIIGEELKEFREDFPYEVFLYNPFRTADKERLEEKLEELGASDVGYQTPVLIMGEYYLAGLDEIRANVKELYRQWTAQGEEETAETGESVRESGNREPEADQEGVTEEPESVRESSPEGREPEAAQGSGSALTGPESGWECRLSVIRAEVQETDSVIIYFSTIACDDCSRVKAVLERLKETAVLPDGTISPVKIYEFNIMEEDYVELLQRLFVLKNVPQKEQLAPIVFYQNGFLSGAGAVEADLEKELSAGQMLGFDGFAELLSEEEMPPAAAGTYLSLMVTGFVNGLNPCGMSMLLMLLAAMAAAGGRLLKFGLAYLAGKYAAYLAMGLGLYHLFLSVNQELLLRVSRGLTWLFAAGFAVLAVMYLLDFVHAKRQEYGKVRMQLPGRLRRWNHKMIERISKVPGARLMPAVFLLGAIISAGEFFCTGQVYLAAILYLMKLQEQERLRTVFAFLTYVTAMCIPSLLLVLAVEKTKNVIRASNTALRWMPLIKLATAIVFLAAAVFFLLF